MLEIHILLPHVEKVGNDEFVGSVNVSCVVETFFFTYMKK